MDAPRTGWGHGTTQTMTISPQDAEKPKHLVLRLKEMKTETEQNKFEAQQKIDASVQQLAHSTLGQSMLAQSQLGHSTLNSMQASFSYINPEISNENEASEVRDEIFKQEDAIEQMQDANFEGHVIDEGIYMANNVQQEQAQISLFQAAVQMCTNVARREGTTLVSALVTGGATVAATLSAPAILGTLAAIGGTVVVGNEVLKMVTRELNDIGASEPLKVLEGALSNLEERNKAAKELIGQAQEKQQQVLQKLTEVEIEIEGLKNDLQTAQGELQDAIVVALKNHEALRRNLMQQSYDAESAIKGTMISMEILGEQKSKILQLMNRNYTIKTEQDLQEVLDGINRELGDILNMSDTTYKQMVTTLNYMLNVSKTQKVVVGLVQDSYKLIGTVKAVAFKLQEAEAKVQNLEEKNAGMQQVIQAQGEDLDKLEQGRKADEKDQEVMRDMIEIEKQKEKFGAESMIIGNFIATGGGATLGFVLAGGIGAAGFGAFGTCLSPTAIRGVHYARKFLRGADRLNDQKVAEKLNSELKATAQKRQQHQTPITIKASYSASQGNVLQKLGKGLWNIGSFATSYATGAQEANYWLSAYAGTVECTLAGIPFQLSFHKNNDANYGAVNVEDQQNLSNILSRALDDGVNPQAVLDLLEGLSHVDLNHEMVVMIAPNSPAMANLKEKCRRML